MNGSVGSSESGDCGLYLDMLEAFRDLGYAPGDQLCLAILTRVCHSTVELRPKQAGSYLQLLGTFRFHPGR